MANPEHLEILNQGVEAVNKWRQDHPSLNLDLSYTDLRSIDLPNVDLSLANLTFTNLLWSKLRGANFKGATLSGTNFRSADLSNADFRNSYLYGANFYSTRLDGANFQGAMLGATTFSAVNLRNVIGLEKVGHPAPSEIGISTIYFSAGQIPEIFLRNCGVTSDFITHIPALVASMQLIQFYSCFISHSSKDHPFAERLHADLQSRGVRCWFAAEDLKIGAEIRTGIDESIRLHDKLLLVLSETSVKSQWVQQEVETALAKEREQGRAVLFPIRLDDTVMQINTGWPAYLKNTRHIGDFTRWKDHDSYRKAFERLLRDLKAEDRQTAEG